MIEDGRFCEWKNTHSNLQWRSKWSYIEMSLHCLARGDRRSLTLGIRRIYKNLCIDIAISPYNWDALYLTWKAVSRMRFEPTTCGLSHYARRRPYPFGQLYASADGANVSVVTIKYGIFRVRKGNQVSLLNLTKRYIARTKSLIFFLTKL